MIPVVEYTYTNTNGEKRHVTRIFDDGGVIFDQDGQSQKCSAEGWEKWCGAKCQSIFDAHFVPEPYMPKAAAKVVGVPDPVTKSEFNAEAKWEKPQQIKKSVKKS